MPKYLVTDTYQYNVEAETPTIAAEQAVRTFEQAGFSRTVVETLSADGDIGEIVYEAEG